MMDKKNNIKLPYDCEGCCYIEKLEKENKKMKEALEFYSKKDYYINDTGYGYSVIDNDIGKKAREALKEINNGMDKCKR